MASPQRSVLSLAWPLVLSFVMRQLFTFVDAWFAGRIGDHAVAGIGLAFPYEFLMIACWVGTSTGMTSLLARAMGAHEGEKIDQVVRTTWRLIAVLVPLFMLLGGAIWIRPQWFVSSGVTPNTLQQFRIYGAVITAGTALTGFWSIIPDSLVKAHHDTRATMWAGFASNLLNVGLNCVFVLVLHWGMFGIAFSTVCGRLGGLVYALAQARRHEKTRLERHDDVVRGLDSHPLKAMLVLAVPSAIVYVLMAAETAILNTLLARGATPTESLASYSVFTRYMTLFSMPIVACGVALLPYTARAWGRRDVGTMLRAWRDVSLAGLAYVVLVVAPVVLIFRVPMTEHFVHAEQTRALTEWSLAFVPVACLLALPFFSCRPVFEGMQRGAPGMIMAILRALVLTPPAAYVGVKIAQRIGAPDVHGIVIALLAVSFAASLSFLLWMRLALAHVKRVAAAAPGVPA